MTPSRIAVFIPDLTGGGGEKTLLLLANCLAKKNTEVDLVLLRRSGPYEKMIPSNAHVTILGSKRMITAIPKLAKYLRTRHPDVMISTLVQANIAALLARFFASVETKIIVVCESVSTQFKESSQLTIRLCHLFGIRMTFPGADSIISVSKAMADDLCSVYKIPREKIKTIYNPVISDNLLRDASEDPKHPWLKANTPVILSVGRLVREKDYDTLIRAFESVQKERPAKLIILGEGKHRQHLESLIKELGIEQDVDLPGFVTNPYAFMSKASVFVLSSLWEGLPGALIEATACGASIVSTDCHSGPREILNSGQYGRLVPVGDPTAMAIAIKEAMDKPLPDPDSEWFKQFETENVTEQYIQEINACTERQITTISCDDLSEEKVLSQDNKLYIFDFCGTLFNSNTTLDFLIHINNNNPRYKRISFLLRWIAASFLRRLHIVDSTGYMRIRIRTLRGISRSTLEDRANEFTHSFLSTKEKKNITSIFNKLLSLEKQVIIASYTLEIISKAYIRNRKTEHILGSTLEYDDNDLCTGKFLCQPEVSGKLKHLLESFDEKYLREACFITDNSKSDKDMLNFVRNPILLTL